MSYETILVEVANEVATISLNRPERANTISPQLVDDVTDAFRSIEADAAVRVVIVTGAGRHFCGGADLKELRSGTGRGLNLDFFNVFEQHPKPVIAAINGAAMGGGCEIALACDIRVIAEDAMIGTPEIKFGALPAGGGTQRLARFVGLGRAKEMIMTGEPITAAEAHRIGLVNSVVPAEQLLAEAERFARIFVRHAPYALATAKRLIQKSLDVDLATGLQLERASIASMASPAERAREQERAAASQAAYGKIFQR
jgi:enoyl-CoA hydratase/carnithine racemase